MDLGQAVRLTFSSLLIFNSDLECHTNNRIKCFSSVRGDHQWPISSHTSTLHPGTDRFRFFKNVTHIII